MTKPRKESRAPNQPLGSWRERSKNQARPTKANGRQAARTRAIVESHDLAEVGQPGPRWDGADPPELERILFHLLQEYARHVGHLDIVSELADGETGE